jgi:hypothetical protein
MILNNLHNQFDLHSLNNMTFERKPVTMEIKSTVTEACEVMSM